MERAYQRCGVPVRSIAGKTPSGKTSFLRSIDVSRCSEGARPPADGSPASGVEAPLVGAHDHLPPALPTVFGLPAGAVPRTSMPEPQPRPAAIQHVSSDPRPEADDAREAALQRVCAGFVTTISPRSAARLADLLSATTYVQAA